MRIEQIRKVDAPGRSRVVADVIWEDRDAPRESLIIETTEEFAPDLRPSADGFLLALFPSAQWHGERRIHIEGTICCRLRDGLAAATELFSMWHEHCRPLSIEPAGGFAATVPRSHPRAACFLSGGIDALSLLRSNRLDYPPDHPGSIRDCLLIHGLLLQDHDESGMRADRLAQFEWYVGHMRRFTDHAGATLIPIYTNIRAWYPSGPSWSQVGYGAGMVGMALCLQSRIDRVKIASVGLGMRPLAQGSQPWLDHHFSTEAVAVLHEQAALSRLEKTRIVSDWPEAMDVLRPCFGRNAIKGQVNCGECEKCVRTMLALLALGRLDRATTFPFDDVTPEMLEPIWIDDPITLPYHLQHVDALTALGRSDLVRLILRKRDAYRIWQRRQAVRGFLRRLTGLGTS